jgi:SAM-dependent methyltransferase
MSVPVERVENSRKRISQPPIEWNWNDSQYQPDWHEPLFHIMARYVAPHSRVLEVGAGGSHTLGAVAKRLECRAYGIEPDWAGVFATGRLADQEGATIDMICGDGFALPFADDSVDFVYSLGLIEHFPDIESARLVNEHVRVCRPGGNVLISVPNWFNLPHTVSKWIKGENYKYYPERSYTSRKLCKVMVASGLRIIATDGLLPLWGIAMIPGGWRVTAAIERLGLGGFISHPKSPEVGALLGYMTFAVGKK